MNSISATNYQIHFNGNAYDSLNEYISTEGLTEVFVLVDDHTNDYCIEQFTPHLSELLRVKIIRIPSGEKNKNIATCIQVWNFLTENGADRNSLLINLGGGMVTDLGGFVASTFKRGIRFINVPTTLLSMVDASVGSKTGVDLNNLKNLIGLFADPEMVLIDLDYLKTLPKRELNSGLAEIVKYGLTFDENLLKNIFSKSYEHLDQLATIVYQSIEIKNKVVKEDFKETGLRKVLNFGHTIGHAIESYYLNAPDLSDLLHGEAIAMGMVVEGYISHKKFNFPLAQVAELKAFTKDIYEDVIIDPKNYEAIMALCKYDKKNTGGRVNFVLLRGVSKFEIDVEVNDDLVRAGIDYYNT